MNKQKENTKDIFAAPFWIINHEWLIGQFKKFGKYNEG